MLGQPRRGIGRPDRLQRPRSAAIDEAPHRLGRRRRLIDAALEPFRTELDADVLDVPREALGRCHRPGGVHRRPRRVRTRPRRPGCTMSDTGAAMTSTRARPASSTDHRPPSTGVVDELQSGVAMVRCGPARRSEVLRVGEPGRTPLLVVAVGRLEIGRGGAGLLLADPEISAPASDRRSGRRSGGRQRSRLAERDDGRWRPAARAARPRAGRGGPLRSLHARAGLVGDRLGGAARDWFAGRSDDRRRWCSIGVGAAGYWREHGSGPVGADMEFRVLGSIEAARTGGPVALGGPRQRRLLAVLLAERRPRRVRSIGWSRRCGRAMYRPRRRRARRARTCPACALRSGTVTSSLASRGT